jgi:hypothetical protein
MAITEAVLKAFIHCPLKAHYLLSGRTLPKNHFDEFDERVERMHLDRARIELGLRLEISTNLPFVHADPRFDRGSPRLQTLSLRNLRDDVPPSHGAKVPWLQTITRATPPRTCDKCARTCSHALPVPNEP